MKENYLHKLFLHRRGKIISRCYFFNIQAESNTLATKKNSSNKTYYLYISIIVLIIGNIVKENFSFLP